MMLPVSTIKLDHYTVKDNHHTTLLDVSLEVSQPGIVAVVGPGGSGKSLLLLALAGRLPRGLSVSGKRKIGGNDGVGGLNTEGPLSSRDIPSRGTVFRALTHPPSSPAQERRVEQILKQVGLWDEIQPRLTHSVRDLTLVQRLMLIPCRALIRGSHLLLLDDPTTSLDPDDAARFEAVVMAAAEQLPVFWASRALRRVAPVATRLAVLAQGKIVAEGPIDRLVVAPPPEAEPAIEAAAGPSAGPGLEGLYHDLLAMGSRAERAVHLAVQSLTDQNLSVAREVIEGDNDLDDRERRIQNRALGLIGRTAPVGRDLRTLTTVLKAATDLARIADHANNISEVTLAIGEEPLIKPLIDIPRMAGKAQTMVRHSLDAMVRRDVALAEEVCQSGGSVDALYRELFEELLGFITDGGDAYRAGQALYLLFVARYLERVADHATHIAEHVIFMVNGLRIPHHLSRENDDFPHPFLPR